mmetsp:Transcript_19805/g.31011  ORF Transcript_19805/g.31011 Transcript_19805/m.31011 type:complete len:248 (+) Transcript_19805:723-1466(+)
MRGKQSVHSSEREIRVGVIVFVGNTVSNNVSLQVDESVASSVTLVNGVSQSGNVDTSIRFTSNVEVVLLEFREFLEEVQQKLVVVISGLVIISVIIGSVVAVAVSNTSGGLKIDHVGVHVPGVWVSNNGIISRVTSVRGKVPGTMFVKETVQRRATRSSVQPESHRVVDRVILRVSKPVVQFPVVSITLRVDLDVTGILIEIDGATVTRNREQLVRGTVTEDHSHKGQTQQHRLHKETKEGCFFFFL